MHQKQCTAHSGEKRPAASIWKNWVPCVFFCFGTCAIIKHKGKLIPQAKQLPVKIDMRGSVRGRRSTLDVSIVIWRGRRKHFRRVLFISQWQGCVKWRQGADSVAGVAFCEM